MFEVGTLNDSIMEKVHILADAAKYDVACTSSGVDRAGKEGMLGNARACGICHSFAADGRCISLLKILMTNHCEFDCKYCINRKSNDVERVTLSPEEICTLTVEFYKRNYIEGLFLSSGVIQSPAYTMEKLCETLLLLRTKYHFNGYIHVKTIPGAPDDLLATAGYLADRMSVNLELPTAESLKKMAPGKTFETVLNPMSKIQSTIMNHREAKGKNALMERASGNRYLENSIFYQKAISMETSAATAPKDDTEESLAMIETASPTAGLILPGKDAVLSKADKVHRAFAPAGQSTQMIIGATQETDYNLIMTTQKLYQTYDLKRVFYSAYIPINEDKDLPAKDTAVPLLREHRLYQADWLMRFYGFQARELLSEKMPYFRENIDPKCDWALRHLGNFPVDVEKEDYAGLLRVPGIGPKSALRILQARRYGHLTFESLKKMGVVLKRAHYFITCGGRMMFRIPIEEKYIMNHLTQDEYKDNWKVSHGGEQYHQMSLFQDFGMEAAR
ncbi:MAG: putative DNA modification/repair radical SAM protein [Lachnospiraceae bacterium]|nr:putative DNA modification/repair radical SAM protein [Lachnospiraceae bacterium]